MGYMEHKHIDALSDKWGGGNPLGNMFYLKAVCGYDDKAGSGALMADGNIDIVADIDEEDTEDVDYMLDEKSVPTEDDIERATDDGETDFEPVV